MAKKANTTRNWTVMVYMAGDNNLDSAGVVDLKEMKKVGSTEQINILVQFDRAGRREATNRYCVQKGVPLARMRCRSRGDEHGGPEGA